MCKAHDKFGQGGQRDADIDFSHDPFQITWKVVDSVLLSPYAATIAATIDATIRSV